MFEFTRSSESPKVCIALKYSIDLPEAPLLSAMLNVDRKIFFSFVSVAMIVCDQCSKTAKRTCYSFTQRNKIKVNQSIHSITDGFVGCYKTDHNATAVALSANGMKHFLIFLMDYNKGMYSENASYFVGLLAGWEKLFNG